MIAPAIRALARVVEDDETDCWVFCGSRSQGYGRVNAGGRNGKPKGVHRVVWEYLRGPIPEGLELDHLCRNRACCNPDHLEPVTRSVNVSRGVSPVQIAALHTSKTHCPQGHPYDDTNTYVNPTRGNRSCRECARASHRRYMRERRSGANDDA